jgi:hypothetical protein
MCDYFKPSKCRGPRASARPIVHARHVSHPHAHAGSNLGVPTPRSSGEFVRGSAPSLPASPCLPVTAGIAMGGAPALNGYDEYPNPFATHRAALGVCPVAPVDYRDALVRELAAALAAAANQRQVAAQEAALAQYPGSGAYSQGYKLPFWVPTVVPLPAASGLSATASEFYYDGDCARSAFGGPTTMPRNVQLRTPQEQAHEQELATSLFACLAQDEGFSPCHVGNGCTVFNMAPVASLTSPLDLERLGSLTMSDPGTRFCPGIAVPDDVVAPWRTTECGAEGCEDLAPPGDECAVSVDASHVLALVPKFRPD